MAHNIQRLASTILNKPQLITQQSFDPIVQYLTARIMNPEFAVYKEERQERDEDERVEMINGVAVISIEGSLSYKPVYTLCGEMGTSYMGLLEQVQYAVDSKAHTIVFEVASGGGEASHCFESANSIRDMLTDAGIYSIAYVDQAAYSAAYALSVVADEVIVNPSAGVGSVGCVVALTDYSKALDKEGIKPIYIASASQKIPFNPDGSFSESFLAKLQEDVNRLGDEFIAHVAKYTGLSEEEIKATNAQTFYADKAVEMGLANAVMNHREFSTYLSSKLKEKQ